MENKLKVGDIVVVTEEESVGIVTDAYDYSSWRRTRMEIKSVDDGGFATTVAIDPRPDRNWGVLRNMQVQDMPMTWPVRMLELHSSP